MIQFTAIVVDDDKDDIENIIEYIAKVPYIRLIGSFENPVEAHASLTGQLPPDIAFLDIEMPELSGLALANLFARQTEIIFVSGHPQFALAAFGIHAAGYLLKPFGFEKFLETVQHVCGKIRSPHFQSPKPEQLLLKTSLKGKYISLRNDDIIYIEAMGNYIKLFTATSNTPSVVYLTLKQALEKLNSANMIRVSRSFMINPAFLEAIDGNMVILKNGKKITVGPTYRGQLQNFIDKSLINNT
ncbi:LytR/AlgR family response regulator transcription factor [Pedobacter deserti]|uniref:LytR/AlgR family response regulator transcription factor n=1 Tax=Pedobacter deserti TaxID=2817382 RepID=UPI00210E3B75|nr:LytTR family DNA-binding domain-containing protein [Pedobacter sp. SYSU D00382]